VELDDINKVTAPLFHYTNMAGLTAIINSQQIWLTSIFHLNDPSELGHGADIALAILNSEADRGDHVVKAFCAQTFFSRRGDDLGQWRAYADNSRGVAIGLAPHLFRVADQTTRTYQKKSSWLV
jgi:hypothetical protein